MQYLRVQIANSLIDFLKTWRSGRLTGIPEHSGSWVETSGMPTIRSKRQNGTLRE
jgi:hypothetical protein